MMTLAISPNEFRGRHFDAAMVLLCVRWYVTYKLSYRDLVEMMEGRGISIAHTTIVRWVQRYIPVLEKSWRQSHRLVGNSWYVDETLYTGQRQVDVSSTVPSIHRAIPGTFPYVQSMIRLLPRDFCAKLFALGVGRRSSHSISTNRLTWRFRN